MDRSSHRSWIKTQGRNGAKRLMIVSEMRASTIHLGRRSVVLAAAEHVLRKRNDGEVAGKNRRRTQVQMTQSAVCSLIKCRCI